MKKAVAVLLALILVLSFAVNAAASGSQSIVLGSAKFEGKNDVQTIAIEANNLDSISVISLVIAYDSTKIELQNVDEEGNELFAGQVSGAAGSLVPDAYVCRPEKGIITIVWEGTNPVSGSGVIAELTFKALSDDAGAQKLSFTTYDGDSSAIYKDNNSFYPEEVTDTEYIEKTLGVTVSGNVTSYLDANGVVTIGLYEGENAEPSYETTMTGNSGTYSIEEVEAGTYTMKVSKKNHVTREYEVTVGEEDFVQDVKIHPVGDISGDGKITNSDVTKSLRHIKGSAALENYEFDCADINGDGKITNSDNTKVLRHAKGIVLLWNNV